MIDSFYLGAYWKNRKEFLDHIITPTLLTLKGLTELDEQFSNLYELGNNRKQALENKVSQTAENIKKLYQEAVKKKDLDQDGYNTIGYNFSVWTGHPEEEASSISFRVGKSSERLVNVCLINFPYQGSAKERLMRLGKVKAIMRLIIQNWDPDTMVLNSRKLSDALGTVNQVGWVTYLKKINRSSKLGNKIIHENNFVGGHLFYLDTTDDQAYDYSLINELLLLKNVLS